VGHKTVANSDQKMIEIFDAAHPDCQALFIFDQSSAHASLGDDALKALR